MVHNKSLRLSAASRSISTTGEIVNLMQMDAGRIATLVMQLHMLWSGLFQVVGCVPVQRTVAALSSSPVPPASYLIQLFVYIGPSALAGVLAMPLFMLYVRTRVCHRPCQYR
jgi:hypothetical protein